MNTRYRPKKRNIEAMQYDGRNHTEILAWANLPGGQLTCKTYSQTLIYRDRLSNSRWDKDQEIKKGLWVIKDGEEFYWLEDDKFQARFEPYKKTGPKPVVIDVDAIMDA